MPVRFSSDQMATCDAIAVAQWFADLREVLDTHYAEMPAAQRDALFADCRADCTRLGIASEMALHAYFDMSFALGRLLSGEQGYMDGHADFLQRFGTADHLPITLYDRAG